MKKISVIRAGVSIDLFEYIEDFYLISEKANPALAELRKGLSTWVSAECYSKMNISLWMYYDDRNPNAFCYYNGGENYIALSSSLLIELWNAANDFVNKENISSLFKISEVNKPKIIESLYFYMLNFTIAHEFGHIAHGHLKQSTRKKCIDEMMQISDKSSDGSERENNWLSQLMEYDADSFAVAVNATLFIQDWSDDIQTNLSNFDMLFISNYLCFRVFAEKTGRNFDRYFSKEIDEYDHPHPGIRMYYSYILYAYWLGETHGFNDSTLMILNSGCHAVIEYEKNILKRQEIKECYFSVAFTEKGVQHLMKLNNGWKDSIDYFNQFSYCQIRRVDEIDSMPFSLDKNGHFLKT